MKVKKLKRFIKSFNKKPNNIKNKFEQRLIEFMLNPYKKELNNHALSWDYMWLRSINITGDYRAIFKEYPTWTYEFVDFTDIGTHSQLYG